MPITRLYPGDDQICVEMARRILSGKAKDVWDAAKQLAPNVPGKSYSKKSRGKVRRLQRHYTKHEKCWLALAQDLPPIARPRRGRKNGLLAHMQWVEKGIRERQAFMQPLINEAVIIQRRMEELNRAAEQAAHVINLATHLPDLTYLIDLADE